MLWALETVLPIGTHGRFSHTHDQADSKMRLATMLASALLLSGCAGAPSLTVFGAAFPDWLFCIAAGVLATALIYGLRVHKRPSAWLSPPVLVYPTLVTLFSLVTWLIFFYR